MPETFQDVLVLAAKWLLPVAVFFIAARPYTTARGRVLSAALAWGVLVGILMPVVRRESIMMIPMEFVMGAVYMAVGMAVMEFIAGRMGANATA